MHCDELPIDHAITTVEPTPAAPAATAAATAGSELVAMLKLAGPVVVAELGWVAMGVVDTIMVGRLGTEAIGAVGLANLLFFAVFVAGMGLLFGLDPLVSQAHGAGERDEARRWLAHGLALGLAISAPLMAVVAWGALRLDHLGADPGLIVPARAFALAVVWSTPPLLAYVALRRYLQAIDRVGLIVVALLSANVINWLLNWLLIEGHWGFPALGVTGSAWSTVIGRVWLMGVLLVAVIWHDRRNLAAWPDALRLSARRMGRLVKLGLPASAHLTLEVGVFAAATALAARLGATSLAAHEITLHTASVTFMVPMGIASAGAVRVGQAIGRGDPAAARRAGWMALFLGVGFMALSAAAFALAPRPILGIYHAEPDVASLGVSLLLVAAVFQLFDGMQVTAAGVLRGAGDTRTAMICNVLAHWAIALPLGYVLGITFGHGVVGLWIGLAAGLAVAGITLLVAWWRKDLRRVGRA